LKQKRKIMEDLADECGATAGGQGPMQRAEDYKLGIKCETSKDHKKPQAC